MLWFVNSCQTWYLEKKTYVINLNYPKQELFHYTNIMFFAQLLIHLLWVHHLISSFHISFSPTYICSVKLYPIPADPKLSIPLILLNIRTLESEREKMNERESILITQPRLDCDVNLPYKRTSLLDYVMNDTTAILIKTLLLTTLLLTLINLTLHIPSLFTVISKVIYRWNRL